MAKLPDRFDLWVRKARECPDPARQADYILGALIGLRECHCLNLGTREQPQPAEAEIEGRHYLLIFSDPGRIGEMFEGAGRKDEALQVITMPAPTVLTWCVEKQAGLLVNPGDDAALVPLEPLTSFHAEWSKRGGREASGFWIPNLTTQEEDFWQEQGL